MLNIVVPMAGAGSRFSKAGFKDPKPLIPIFGKPMIQLVINNGGIEYAHKRMTELANEALEIIKPLPESAAKRSLIGLVHYTINRDK
jgi:geranylgeranyl pyrophosphate synthase